MANPKKPAGSGRAHKADIESLTPDQHNANRGTDRGREIIRESLKRYGAGRSILVDKAGRVIAGNHVLEGAAEAGIKEVLIVPSDGTRLIVVQRNDLDLEKDDQARELAVADNRSTELNLAWDPAPFQDRERMSFMFSPLEWADLTKTTPHFDRAPQSDQTRLDGETIECPECGHTWLR